MIRFIYIFLLAVLLPGVCDADGRAPASPHLCERIVSLAPSVTETLFALGLGPRVKGVTRYCRYPSEAEVLPHIGGLFDINREKIALLKPDIIVGLQEHSDVASLAARIESAFIQVDHGSVAGIMASIERLGSACAVPFNEVLAPIQAAVGRARTPLADETERLRVLIAVGRETLTESPPAVYLSGNDGFYSDIVRLAGGKNVLEDATVSLAGFSPETLLALSPDIIIEIAPRASEKGWTVRQIADTWRDGAWSAIISKVPVKVITSPYSDIPGPRFVSLLREVRAIIDAH